MISGLSVGHFGAPPTELVVLNDEVLKVQVAEAIAHQDAQVLAGERL